MPPSWKDFKNYLKHKQKDMSIDMIVRLCIEEDNKIYEKHRLIPAKVKANMVKHGQNSNSEKNKIGKWSKLGPNGRVSKKQKFNQL